MDENDKPDTRSWEEVVTERNEKIATKLAVVKAVKQISNPNSKWTLTQELFQEVVATHTVSNPYKLPGLQSMVDDLRTKIEIDYKDEEETKELLLSSIPNQLASIKSWTRRKDWEEAVWTKIRDRSLFSKERRSEVIHALYKRALDKSDNAAKIWLTLSGDYSEKGAALNDKTLDTFREINEILHKKSNKE